MQPPKIDQRTYQEIVEQTENLAKCYAEWNPRSDGKPDAGRALIRIFGRMAALVSDRLNQVPDKNFLAFLDLIGTQILPPQPAHVPLTFYLVEGSPVDAFVPAKTPVAAPPTEVQEQEVVFQTDRELVVTRAQLQAVFVRQPETDRYSDNTLAATGAAEPLQPGGYPAFEASDPIPHCFYIACDELFTLSVPKTATLTIYSPEAADFAKLPVTWSYWDSTTWKPLLGIVEGLTVTLDEGSSRVWVAAGNAIDSQGREIQLADKTFVDLTDYKGQSVLLVISATSTPATPELAVVPDSNVGDSPAKTHIRLAHLAIASDGLVSFAPLCAAQTTASANELSITINSVPPVAKRSLDGLEAGWLQARLSAPVLPDQTPLTHIDRINVNVNIARENLTPDLCFFNAAQLDITKDFGVAQ